MRAEPVFGVQSIFYFIIYVLPVLSVSLAQRAGLMAPVAAAIRPCESKCKEHTGKVPLPSVPMMPLRICPFVCPFASFAVFLVSWCSW